MVKIKSNTKVLLDTEKDVKVEENGEKLLKSEESIVDEKNGDKAELMSIDMKEDEYDYDSSDEEDVRNTVGNIPMQWYDNFAHIGYDTSGRPIMKPNVFFDKPDLIDEFLEKTNTSAGGSDPKWRTVTDPMTGQSVVLSDRHIDIITKMAKGKGVLGANEENPYAPFEDIFTKDKEIMPVHAIPPAKRHFIPSFIDRKRVSRMVHALKRGFWKPCLPPWAVGDENNEEELSRYAVYITTHNPAAIDSEDEDEDVLGFSSNLVSDFVFPDVWEEKKNDEEEMDPWRHALPPSLRGIRPPRPKPYVHAPPEALPGHAESYNPPPEYLLSKEEESEVMEKFRDLRDDNLVNKTRPWIPKRFECLRHVPFSNKYMFEREQRVKDLVQATRCETEQVDTTPASLLPRIPNVSELRPYPSKGGLIYTGHVGPVTGISVSPCGAWLATASPADGTLRIWEVATDHCFRLYQLVAPRSADVTATSEVEESEYCAERPKACVQWSPSKEMPLVAVAFGAEVFIINPGVGDAVATKKTEAALDEWWSTMLTTRTPDDQVDGAAMDTTSQPTSAKQSRVSSVVSSDVTWSIEMPSENKHRDVRSRPAKATFGGGAKKSAELRVKKTRPDKTLEFGRVKLTLAQPVIDLQWHANADYLVTLTRSIKSSEASTRDVRRLILHRLSRITSQLPFNDTQNTVEEWRQASFHPGGKPILFLSTDSKCRMFDLIACKELRSVKLEGSSLTKLSSTAIHPSGEHVLMGTFDGKFCWFDVELGATALKKLRLQHGAVRQVVMHRHRPLVSCAMDDGSLLIIHGSVPSNDLMSKPVVIPVQLIHAVSGAKPILLNEGQVDNGVSRQKAKNMAAVYATQFHPTQPSVYSGHADGSVRQFVSWY